MGRKKRKMRGTVKRVFRPSIAEPEKAEIAVHEADELYREIRIENVVTDEQGQQERLKPGADVDVTIEADSDATTKSQS